MKRSLLYQATYFFVMFSSIVNAQCPADYSINYVSDNLLINPSFERGQRGYDSELEYVGRCNFNTENQMPNQYTVPTANTAPSECSNFWTPNLFAQDGRRYFLADFPTDRAGVNLYCQSVNVETNTTYEFSGYFANVLNEIYDNNDPQLSIQIEGSNSVIGEIYNSRNDISITESEGWQYGAATFDTEDNVEILLCIQNVNFGRDGLDVAFDNFSLRKVECLPPTDPDTNNNSNDDVTFYDCNETIMQLSTSVLNGGFEEGSYFIFEDGSINIDQIQIDAWSRAAFDRNIQITDSGHNGIQAYEGNAYSRVNAISNSSIYQDIATLPGDILHYSFAHRGAEGVDQVAVYLGTPKANGQEPLSSELANSYATDNDRWVVYEGKYEVPAGQTITRFSLGALSSSNGNLQDGNLIDAVTLQSVNSSCLAPMRGNVEICGNGIDDDNDGFIDDADPDCSTSGGNNGGLESNGRLAEKIFQRTLNRRINPSIAKNTKADMLRKEKTATYGVFNSTIERSALSIEDFIPIDTLANTETFISSPTDLELITNASEVFSVDIFRGDSRLAAIFATTTENGVYEHTKYICDRLKGGAINDLKSVRIGYADFVVADILQPEGNREYALSFSAREINDDKLEIQSHWSLEHYPAEEDYYNFQIWASNEDDLKKLALKTMQLLNEYKQIATMTTTGSPSVFVSKGEYKNGLLNLKLINKTNSTRIDLEGRKTTTETISDEAIELSSNINGGYSEFVTLEVGSVYDMGFRIKHDNDTIFDDLFIADGLWFVDTQEDNISYEVSPAISGYTEEAYPLERSIKVSGFVTNSLNVYRTMKPNFNPVDVSAFNTLHFNLEGKHAIQVILIKESVPEWENQYKTSITTTSGSNEINIPLSRFSNGSGEAISLDDIQAIIFKIENGGETEQVDLEISNLEFRNQEDTFSTDVLTNNRILATPNPSKGNVNITWKSATEGIHNAIFSDINGRTIKEFRGLTSVGLNQIVIERNNLLSGIYFISIIEQSGKIRNEKIVLID